MGANNSQPQTVQMTNPIQITRDVAERINQATAKNTSLGSNLCETCRQKAESGSGSTLNDKSNEIREVQLLNVAKSWKKRSSEAEESHFDKSMQRVQELFGKPVKWAKECESEIGNLEVELLQCYRRYPNEPLQCSNLARQYHYFVFARQNAEMAKMNPDDHRQSQAIPFNQRL